MELSFSEEKYSDIIVPVQLDRFVPCGNWSGVRDSDPIHKLGRLRHNLYTNPACSCISRESCFSRSPRTQPEPEVRKRTRFVCSICWDTGSKPSYKLVQLTRIRLCRQIPQMKAAKQPERIEGNSGVEPEMCVWLLKLEQDGEIR